MLYPINASYVAGLTASLESTTYSYDTNGNRTVQTKIAGPHTETTTYRAAALRPQLPGGA